MKTSDWMMILAILLAPLVAIQVSVYLEKRRERRKRKLDVFSALMATRASVLSPKHVEALNMIDIEFYGETKVTRAWKNYLDHLNDRSLTPEVWNNKTTELLTEMLYVMAQSLEYDFDKVQIKRSAYFPRGYGDIENDQLTIRKALVEILSGKKSFPMEVTRFPIGEKEIAEQEAIRSLLRECLEGKRSLPVTLSQPLEKEKRA